MAFKKDYLRSADLQIKLSMSKLAQAPIENPVVFSFVLDRLVFERCILPKAR